MRDLAVAFTAERIVFSGKIVIQDPSQSVFVDGRLQRIRQYVRVVPNVHSGKGIRYQIMELQIGVQLAWRLQQSRCGDAADGGRESSASHYR